MLAVCAFFLLLTVFSLAAQFIGYLAYRKEKSARETRKNPPDDSPPSPGSPPLPLPDLSS